MNEETYNRAVQAETEKMLELLLKHIEPLLRDEHDGWMNAMVGVQALSRICGPYFYALAKFHNVPYEDLAKEFKRFFDLQVDHFSKNRHLH